MALAVCLSRMQSHEKCRYTFFLMIACREKEVAHGRWSDLILKGNVPHFVVQAKKFKYSDGSAGEFTTKSHERREIPMLGSRIIGTTPGEFYKKEKSIKMDLARFVGRPVLFSWSCCDHRVARRGVRSPVWLLRGRTCTVK